MTHSPSAHSPTVGPLARPRLPVNPIGLPPGPRGVPKLGILPELSRAPLPFFMRQREIFGDYVTLPFGQGTVILISSPEGAKQVLQDHAAQYMKGRGHQLLRSLLGNGLLTAEGPLWLSQRRLAQPSFSRTRLAAMASGMEEVTRAVLLPRLEAAARTGAPLDLAPVMMEAALGIVLRALFGTELAQADYQAVERAMPSVLGRAVTRTRNPLSFEIFTPAVVRGVRGERALKAVVDRLIAGRRIQIQQTGAALDEHWGEDLLGTYMGAGMDDEQLRDEVMTLFLAGHETTASLLTSLFWFLGQHPVWLDAVQAEARALSGPVSEQTRSLKLLDACLSETLRLSPPAWAVPRWCLEEDEVAGYRIPAGVGVMISPYVMHRHPDHWERPEVFDPQRFLDFGRVPAAFMPFGGGPRQCIGNHFALLEAGVVAASVLREYRLTPTKGGPLEMLPSITLRPKSGAMVRVERA
ncbi:cytochrome P450 [Deinococcus sp.]|uniref:cytochrome P450 n=1 Tax=Deinococcus sp. TaxID=47478 RepID=UPI0025D7BB35|nr:cytochrome P450 [Deinococcus sp.]